MCFDYDDYPEFSRAAQVKARKPHRCSACGATIQAGDEYESISGKSDGYFWVSKVCRRCCYDRYRIVEHELAEGCKWQEAWPAVDDIVEHLHETGLGQTRPEDVPAGFKLGDMPKIPVALTARH